MRTRKRRRLLGLGVITLTLLATLSIPAPTLAAWSGWSQVPGNGFTYAAPNAVSYGGRLYLFVYGGGDGVYVNVKNGSAWSGWAPVPGNLPTYSAPTAVVYNNHLWLIVRGPKGHLTRNIYNGASWSGWSTLSLDTGYGAPEAVAYGGGRYVFDRYINSIKLVFYEGTSGPSGGTVPGNGETPVTSAAAVYGNRLWLFVTGTDSRLYRNIYDGLSWTGWSALPGTA